MFLTRPWTLGKIFGIPLRIDPSWLLIFLLLVYQLAFIVFPYELGVRPRRGIPFDLIALAVAASLLLFASVLAHELAHALMARTRGVSVLSITLFIFGGIAQIGDEPDSPATEFLIAIVGPLISFVIAIFAGAVWIWLQAFDALGVFYQTPLPRLALYVSVVAFYLAQTNLLLAVFNLLPGFPLDGGRVLRALVWAVLKDPKRATYWGMLSGRGLALLMAGVGVFFILRGEYDGGWALLMAWFLWRAAGDAYHGMLARELLKQVTVGELMRSPASRVSEALSLRELAEQFSSWLRAPALAVDLQGVAVGMIGIAQLEKFNRAHWETTRVRQAMLPLSPDNTVRSTAPALQALQVMTEREREALAVVQGEQALGIIGREELARYLQTKGE
ncbi:MAG: site-2 protease family protein [Chloroflexi bacterium]|nr:site-2 protease family protein [Chloroflexota bacterium]